MAQVMFQAIPKGQASNAVNRNGRPCAEEVLVEEDDDDEVVSVCVLAATSCSNFSRAESISLLPS